MSDRMLPKLNRNTSMVNNTSGGMAGGGPASGGFNSLEHNAMDGSPLKLFSRAKQAINSIYQQFYGFIGEVNVFLDCNLIIDVLYLA